MFKRFQLREFLRDTPLEGLGIDDLVLLGAVSRNPGHTSDRLAERLKGRGRTGERLLGRRRVERAIARLVERGLMRSEPGQDGARPVLAATEEGASALRDFLMAAEIAEFEPDLRQGLLADEARGPFRKYRGRTEL